MPPHKDYCLDPRPPATPTLPQSPVLADALQVCHPHAAGIDIGEAEPWVAHCLWRDHRRHGIDGGLVDPLV